MLFAPFFSPIVVPSSATRALLERFSATRALLAPEQVLIEVEVGGRQDREKDAGGRMSEDVSVSGER